MYIASIFITFVYQPFFNILVGFYWFLGSFTDGKPDMGIAVILLTLLIRFILLPMSISGKRTEGERREIAEKIAELDKVYDATPIKREAEKKKVISKSKRVLISELINLTIQVIVALMLYKIFATGLKGADLHLIYSFMPDIELPFNLIFLGKYDLSKTNLTLNLIQSLLIFILETISVYASPYKVSKNEVVRLQLVLPVVSFIIFMGLPAGKKLFVITSLIVSIIIESYRAIKTKFNLYKEEKVKEQEDQGNGEIPEEKIVVETK
jgi:membrane protein insertase Oxa1/YidC/SpoIIIJ